MTSTFKRLCHLEDIFSKFQRCLRASGSGVILFPCCVCGSFTPITSVSVQSLSKTPRRETTNQAQQTNTSKEATKLTQPTLSTFNLLPTDRNPSIDQYSKVRVSTKMREFWRQRRSRGNETSYRQIYASLRVSINVMCVSVCILPSLTLVPRLVGPE